jgi:hypothetical protein
LNSFIFLKLIEKSIARDKKLMRYFQKVYKRVLTVIIALVVVYGLLISPIFFLYPNHNRPLDKNIEKKFFHEISDELKGDCYRICQNFSRECPFPNREIHLNSEHTIVEIFINEKWYAYDPLFKKFFNDNNVIQISFDVNRGYMPTYLENYEYASSFKEVKYYHSHYFVFLKYICPFYDELMRRYYSVS